MSTQTLPWYKEPWPWLVMAGPAIVVVASFITLGLAISSNDGLVADNYYKEGLAINRALEHDARARALGLAAILRLSEQGGAVHVDVKLDNPAGRSSGREVLHLILAHPTRVGLDREANLMPDGRGGWRGTVDGLPAGRWHMLLEAPAAWWRLVGEWDQQAQSVKLEPVPGEAAK